MSEETFDLKGFEHVNFWCENNFFDRILRIFVLFLSIKEKADRGRVTSGVELIGVFFFTANVVYFF